MAWLDGELLAVDEARVSVFDHGLTVGDGVFETLRSYAGRPFAVRRHLDRLEASAAGLGLSVPSRHILQAALDEVMTANRLHDAALRITVTGGTGPLGSARGSSGPTVVVAAAPLAEWPPTADVAVVPWPRNERGALAGLKTISYGENVVALTWAVEQGATEALFANVAGKLCEGTSTNVFVGIGGELVTPPLSAGCLAGVTRQLVVESGPVVERDVDLHELSSADEAFLTSTTREVQPIRAVDGHVLGAAPGPLTRAASEALADVVARDVDP